MIANYLLNAGIGPVDSFKRKITFGKSQTKFSRWRHRKLRKERQKPPFSRFWFPLLA